MLISPAYAEQNRQLHASSPNYGTSGARWAPYVERLVRTEGYGTILDYGAGKGTLAKALPGLNVSCYDPAVPEWSRKPQPADLVVCGDVLEHIEPAHLTDVLRDLQRVTRRKLFFVINTRPAKKTLPDGRNAHLIVEQHDWWRAKLANFFCLLAWEVRPGLVYGEGFPLPPRKPFKRPTKRREMTPQVRAMFDHIRTQAAKYQDATTQIDTIRMFEGVGDKPADMQVCHDFLEHWPDPDEPLLEMCRMARVAVMASIRLIDARTEGDWRKVFERRLRIADWHREGNQVMCVGSPMVGVAGVTARGAVAEDALWPVVLASRQRITKRIEVAPPHGRRAILACYGPSLASTMDALRLEMAASDCDVVSVSGAHDFLLSRCIVPRYHVECDPRPHKADNIATMCENTAYLLASCVSPVVFDKLGADADIRLWHIASASHGVRLIDEHGENPKHIITGGGSVGLRSIPLLYAMGYRDFSVYGMDCSFADDGQTQWAGKHAGKRQELIQVQCGERMFVTSPVLATYASDFWEMYQKLKDCQFRLYGDGLLANMARYYAAAGQPQKGVTTHAE